MITIIVGIVTSLIAIWSVWYFLMLPKLSYSVNILPFVNPKNTDASIKDKLKILYANKEVDSLNIIKIDICNKGFGTAEYFSSPLKIECTSRILAVYSNNDIFLNDTVASWELLEDQKSIMIKTKYINPKEKMTFNVIVEANENIHINVKGRCKGCSKVKKDLFAHIRSNFGFFLAIFIGFSIGSYYNYLDLKIDGTEQRLDMLCEENIKQYEKLLDLETKRADLICQKSHQFCIDCKEMLLEYQKSLPKEDLTNKKIISKP